MTRSLSPATLGSMVLGLLLCSVPAFAADVPVADTEPFTMGLWGDMPYAKANDSPKIPALLADMNASDIAFSIYDGDIKDGSSKCTDDIYANAITMFNALEKPVVYIPGDNEWTDCHRTNNGGYDSLERLDYLRKTMLAKPESFGKAPMPLVRQGPGGAKFSENVRFTKGNVMFVGLNVPGSNNNKVNDADTCTKKSARTPEQCTAANAEYEDRDKANISWLHESFVQATAAKNAGIMIVFQGDLGFDLPETEEIDESRTPGHDGYARFLDALMAETKGFPGLVVIVHGDTHFFKIDKPLASAGTLLPNLTRVQTFGSPNVHWVKVAIDPASREVFSFLPEIVPGN